MQDHGEARAFPGAILVGGVVHPAQIHHQIEGEPRFVAQGKGHLDPVLGLHLDGELTKSDPAGDELVAEGVLDTRE